MTRFTPEGRAYTQPVSPFFYKERKRPRVINTRPHKGIVKNALAALAVLSGTVGLSALGSHALLANERAVERIENEARRNIQVIQEGQEAVDIAEDPALTTEYADAVLAPYEDVGNSVSSLLPLYAQIQMAPVTANGILSETEQKIIARKYNAAAKNLGVEWALLRVAQPTEDLTRTYQSYHFDFIATGMRNYLTGVTPEDPQLENSMSRANAAMMMGIGYALANDAPPEAFIKLADVILYAAAKKDGRLPVDDLYAVKALVKAAKIAEQKQAPFDHTVAEARAKFTDIMSGLKNDSDDAAIQQQKAATWKEAADYARKVGDSAVNVKNSPDVLAKLTTLKAAYKADKADNFLTHLPSTAATTPTLFAAHLTEEQMQAAIKDESEPLKCRVKPDAGIDVTTFQGAVDYVNQYKCAQFQVKGEKFENDKSGSLVALKWATMLNAKNYTGVLKSMKPRDIFSLGLSMVSIESQFLPTAKAKTSSAEGLAQMTDDVAFTLLVQHIDKTAVPGGQDAEINKIKAAKNNIIQRYVASHYSVILPEKDKVQNGHRLTEQQQIAKINAEGWMNWRHIRKAYATANPADRAIVDGYRTNTADLSFNGEHTTVGAYLSIAMGNHLFDEKQRIDPDLAATYRPETMFYATHQRGAGDYDLFIRDLRLIDKTQGVKNTPQYRSSGAYRNAVANYREHNYVNALKNRSVYFPSGTTNFSKANMLLPRDVLAKVRDEHFGRMPTAARVLADNLMKPNDSGPRIVTGLDGDLAVVTLPMEPRPKMAFLSLDFTGKTPAP